MATTQATAPTGPDTKDDIANAYHQLGCRSNTSDEDIIVAYYSKVSYMDDTPVGLLGSLKTIAQARQSRFLVFVLSIHQHLDDSNVAILAKKTPFVASPDSTESPEPALLQPGSMSEDVTGLNTVVEPFGMATTTSEEDDDEELHSPSSSEADIPSSSEDERPEEESTAFDFQREKHVYFESGTWHCNWCSVKVDDVTCAGGHDLHWCQNCKGQFVSSACPECDAESEACGGQQDGFVLKEEDDEEDEFMFDCVDGVWRCVNCHWEVEADSSEAGTCHCINDQGEQHYVDLSDRMEYEPADSCTSEDDSSSEDPDSEDERFIDDEETADEESSTPLVNAESERPRDPETETSAQTVLPDDLEIT